ncbi:MAG: hypothetical protein CVU47_06860 [Chloroflexi bacterium HGW-Chloroflexi-9]|nr:MAG: hypothetical protein CVU47_06860 [Chloroflexi bacterium HGW-Chloroflexi-9]
MTNEPSEPNEPEQPAEPTEIIEPAEAPATSSLIDRLRAHPRLLTLGGAVAVLVAAIIAAVLVAGPGGPVAGQAVEISPVGPEVPRLGPVVVTFRERPRSDDANRLIALEPSVEGDYAWLDERTLIFQPAFPGFARGADYTIRVDGGSAGLDQDVVQAFTVEGKLTVQGVIPGPADGGVPTESQIYVQFSRSVAPLTTLEGQRSDPVIVVDPPLQGQGEWLNTSLYRFIPTDLKPSTTYRVRVPAGLTAITDGVLEADYEWSFTTFSPALARSTPAEGALFFGRNAPITLQFNQPMDRESVAAAIVLRVQGGDVVPTEASWDESGVTLTLDPVSALTLSTGYEIVLPAGLKGAATGASEKERIVRFNTSDPPRLLASSPADGETNAGRYGITLEFNNPIDIESLEARLSVSGVPATAWELFSWDERSVQLNLPLDPSTTYVVRTTGGVLDREGLPLDPISITFTTGALDPSVSYAVPSQMGTYAASVDQLLYYYATNVASVEFELYALGAADLMRILEQGSLPQGTGNQSWAPSSAPLRRWTEAVEGARNVPVQGVTSLGNGEPLVAGHYYVRTPGTPYGGALAFSVVDTAITTKLSNDELLIWALDHDSGTPVGNLELAVSGPGVQGVSVRTDAQGFASVVVPRPRDVVDTWRMYVVRTDGARTGLARSDWSQGMDLWQIGVPVEYTDRDYVGYAFTDRPIYRSGETVYYKAVIRQDDDARYSVPAGDLPLRLAVYDAAGEEIVTRPVQLNEFGTLTGEFELPEEATTGFYTIAIVDSNREWFWVAGASFQVAEFRRPEFRVEVTPERGDYVDGETIEAEAAASFFFGGALAGADVTWTALGYPSGVFFPDYDRYSFSDFDFFDSSFSDDPLRGNGETVTDGNGIARIRVPAALRAGESTTLYDLSVTVLDQTGQAIASTASVTVHPAEAYVGVDASAYVATVGEPVTIDLVTVNTVGEPLGGRAVTVEVYEREWITVKEQTDSGARRYRSEPRDTLVATLQGETGADGLGEVVYTPANTGQLRIVARTRDAAGREARAARYLWVSGDGVATWEFRNDSVISLVADRALYRPGDTAEVLVPAPFAGARALVTTERGRILEHSTWVFEGNSEVLRIPITEEMLPNVFIGVVLYRPPTEEDPVPRFHVGYAELRVTTDSRELTIDLQRDLETAKPGETVTYDIAVTNSDGQGVEAELSIAMVDAAVLSLAGEGFTPTGLQAFWFNRGLAVQTGSSLAMSIDRLNDAVSAPELGGKGGGADESGTRSDFQNTAYWTGQLKTDASGRASVKITLPDNLTTWRTTVRAITVDTKVGEAVDDLVATQPLLVRPALPRFLRVGDEVTLRTLVRNATDTPQQVSVSIEATGVALDASEAFDREIAPGASAEFAWRARATEAGTATITFTAGGSDLADAVLTEIPVLFDVTAETVATGGVVTGTSQVEGVYLPAFAVTAGGTLDLTVQGSLIGSLQSELVRLAPQERESVVRTASRLLATLAARQADGVQGDALLVGVEGDLRRLQAAQRIDGGWGWCQTCPSDVTITSWVLVALGAARDAGAENAAFGEAAVPLLRQYLEQRPDAQAPADPNERAFIYYAVQRASGGGWAMNSMRAVFEQRREQLTPWGRAYLILGLIDAGQPASDDMVRGLVSDLNASALPTATGNHWEGDAIYGSIETNVSMTALVLQALVVADPQHPLIEETVRWLVTARTAQRWTGAVERAQAIMGLGDYAALTGERAGDYDYRVTFNDAELLAGRFAPAEGRNFDAASLPLSSVKVGEVHRLGFSRERTDARMYYTAALRYGIPSTEVEALNRGLAVSRRYSLMEDPDQVVTQARLGQIIRVSLTVVATADRKFVSVEDLLPAGLEAIDTTLATTPAEVRVLLAEERRLALEDSDTPGISAPWFGWYWSPWDESAVRDDRYTLFASELPRGVHEYVYYARATTPGDFFVAPARAEEAPFPEVFGRSDSTRFIVTE